MMLYCVIEENTCTTSGNEDWIPWWSFGKTVLATCILRLVEENKLDLQGQYFNNKATLIQVLRHEAGYGDYGYESIYQKAVDQNESPWTFDEMIEKTNNEALIFDPGSHWQYSNIAYYHLRRLIEETTKLSITEALNNLIFHAIGIMGVKVAKSKEDLELCRYVSKDYHPKWLYHGMLIGSLKAACQFLNHLSKGRILSKETLEVMQDIYPLNFSVGHRPWQQPAYALGLMVDNRKDEKYSYGHTGMGPDSVISVYHFPKLQPPKTIAVIMDTDDQSQVENMLVSLL